MVNFKSNKKSIQQRLILCMCPLYLGSVLLQSDKQENAMPHFLQTSCYLLTYSKQIFMFPWESFCNNRERKKKRIKTAFVNAKQFLESHVPPPPPTPCNCVFYNRICNGAIWHFFSTKYYNQLLPSIIHHRHPDVFFSQNHRFWDYSIIRATTLHLTICTR